MVLRNPDPLRAAVLDALAVVFPIGCAGCGVEDRGLCADCRRQLQPYPVERLLGDGTPVWAALVYEGVVRSAILGLKEHGRTDLVRALAAPLGSAVSCAAQYAGSLAHGAVELAIPPVSRASFRRRGYDPVRLIVRAAGLPRPATVLVSVHDRASQKTLDRAERAVNLAGSMAPVRSLQGRRFIVLDDVVTTGATLTEVIRSLRGGGAEVVGAAVLAATPRRLLGVS